MVTVNVPAVPTVKVVWSALVMVGAWLTVSVNAWVASGATPLLAVMVIGKVPPAVGVPAEGRGAVTVVGEGHARPAACRSR